MYDEWGSYMQVTKRNFYFYMRIEIAKAKIHEINFLCRRIALNVKIMFGFVLC